MLDTASAGELSPAKEQPSPSPTRLAELSPKLIQVDPNQPRRKFDEEFIRQLAVSFAAHGVIEPLVVRPFREGDLQDDTDANATGAQYRLIAGENRLRAAIIAGLAVVPSVIRDGITDDEVIVIQLLENLQRKDLSLGETAVAVSKLVDQIGFGKTCEQLGKDEKWVSQHASLVKLPAPVMRLVGDNIIQSAEIAQDMGKLYELDKQKAQYRIDEFVSCAKNDRPPPTRSQLRELVRSAKNSVEQKEKQKAEKAKLREKAKTDPKIKKQLEADRKKEEAKKGIRDRKKKAAEYCSAFAERMTMELSALAGLKKPKKETYGGYRNAALHVSPPHFSDYDSSEPPKTAEVAHYSLHLDGSYETVTAGAALLGTDPKVSFNFHDKISLAQAEQLQKILGDKCTFYCTAQYTGIKLEALLKAKPAAASKTTEVAADHVAQFLNERTRKLVGSKLKAQELYDAYKAWCGEKGLTPIAFVHNDYGNAIAAAGIEKIRSNGIRYVGIALKPVAP